MFNAKKLLTLLAIIVVTLSFSCSVNVDSEEHKKPDSSSNTNSTPSSYSLTVGIVTDSDGAGRIDRAITTINGSYKPNSDITIKAIPEKGSIFTGWYDAEKGGNFVALDSLHKFKLSQNTTIYARFELRSYTFFTEIAPGRSGGGSISNTTINEHGRHKEMKQLTATAIPDSKSFFLGWFDAPQGGNIVSREKMYTFNLKSDTTLYAQFEINNIIFASKPVNAAVWSAVQANLNKTNNNLTFEEVSTIKELIVTNLTFYKTRDLTGLETVVNLNSLRITKAQIVDITPLKNLTNLTYIDLSDNNIKDISTLLDSPLFHSRLTINITGNPLPAEQIEALRQRVLLVYPEKI